MDKVGFNRLAGCQKYLQCYLVACTTCKLPPACRVWLTWLNPVSLSSAGRSSLSSCQEVSVSNTHRNAARPGHMRGLVGRWKSTVAKVPPILSTRKASERMARRVGAGISCRAALVWTRSKLLLSRGISWAKASM